MVFPWFSYGFPMVFPWNWKTTQETNAALANSDEFLGELVRRLETDGDPESSHWDGTKKGSGNNNQNIAWLLT